MNSPIGKYLHNFIFYIDWKEFSCDADKAKIFLLQLKPKHLGIELFGLADSVTGHFGHDISLHKQLITFVYLNE